MSKRIISFIFLSSLISCASMTKKEYCKSKNVTNEKMCLQIWREHKKIQEEERMERYMMIDRPYER